VMPRSVSKRYPNVFGPINGNIYYPQIFRKNETLPTKLRRMFHLPAQRLNRIFSTAITKADVILCAGGLRTKSSLLAAGCRESIIFDTLDCGIRDEIVDRPRIRHEGVNFRFVHFGRLVFHKGTSLVIESLARTKHPIHLDIIGRGPELENCQRLTRELGLVGRVDFLDWFADHTDLLDSFSQYRGALLPSLEDANGIVVQEAMALGLPMICLNWGGPQLLIQDQISGYLIDPTSKNDILKKMSECLDRLATDADEAENLSSAAKTTSENWRWSRVIRKWISLYPSIPA
jgi:glycosyltransferase involved in cell wall biosynthesis